MIFCDGICIVTVRSDTRTICWNGQKMSVRPGPRTPVELAEKEDDAALILPQHAKRAREIEHDEKGDDAENGDIHDVSAGAEGSVRMSVPRVARG